MSSILPIPTSAPAVVSKPTSSPGPAQAPTSSLFGNLLRKTEVAMGARSKTGFSAGATYEATTIAGQTKAAINDAVDATKSFLHIK